MIKNEIDKQLKQKYNFVKTNKYIPLFIVAINPKIWNLSNVENLCVVLPTTKDILNNNVINTKLVYENKYIIVQDIRIVLKEWLNSNIYYLTILFSNNMLVNKTYRIYMDSLKNIKEDIVNIDKLKLYKNIINEAKIIYNNIIFNLQQNKKDKLTKCKDIEDLFYKLICLKNIYKNLVNNLSFKDSLKLIDKEDEYFLQENSLKELYKEDIETYLNLYYTKLTNNTFDIDIKSLSHNYFSEDKLNNIIQKLLVDVICKDNNIQKDNSFSIQGYDNIYFTSDLHFGHKNILEYEHRDIGMNIFPTIENHDNKLIYNWNSVVKNNDLVFILGDLSFYNAETTNNIVKRLNGSKVLILR